MQNRTLALSLFFVSAFLSAQPAHAETTPRTVEITADRDDTGVTVAATNDTGTVFTINLEFSTEEAKACDLTAVASDGTSIFDQVSSDCQNELATMLTDVATATADSETPMLLHRMAMVLVLGKRDIRPATSGGVTAPTYMSSGSTFGGYATAPSATYSGATGMVVTPQRTTTTSYERETSASVTVAPKTITKTAVTSFTQSKTVTATKAPAKIEPVKTEYKTEYRAPASSKGTAPTDAKAEAKAPSSGKEQALEYKNPTATKLTEDWFPQPEFTAK